MIVQSLEIFYSDQYTSGPSTIDGTVRTETISLTGVVGTPQYRLKTSDSWTDLDVDGSFYRFEVLKAADSYQLELQDGGAPGAISIIDFQIESPTAKCGREAYVDVVYNLIIDQTNITFDVSFPFAQFIQGYVLIGSTLEGIPITGSLVKLWADVGSPLTSHYELTPFGGGANCVAPNFIAYQPSSGSACDLVVSSPTITQPNRGQSDGVIQLNATSSANITYSLDGSPFQTSNTFTGLPAGEYTATIRDDSGNCSDVTQEIVLTEKYFRIPRLNGIEFKVPDTKRQNLNNTLFVEMIQPVRARKNAYCQTYFNDDVVPVQFQSNFASHTVTIYEYRTSNALATIVPVSIYPSPENFNYWEFTINMALYSGKSIQVTIIPTGETLGNGNAGISEPIQVLSENPEQKYVKVATRSNINNSDIYWLSGFAPFLHVKGQVADSFAVMNKEIARDCAWNLNTQSRELIRQLNFQVFDQPAYIYEKLQWWLGNGKGDGDFYFVNDVSVNTEEAAYEDPDFTSQYSLGDSVARLEERNLFTGDLSLTPTPVVTLNYLLVNPSNDGGLLVSPDDEYLLV